MSGERLINGRSAWMMLTISLVAILGGTAALLVALLEGQVWLGVLAGLASIVGWVGNPVEIAAVINWQVVDTARATFDVEDYENFVQVQAEAAIRHVASEYPYDNVDDGGPSLRANADDVTATLQAELQDRLDEAGVTVRDCRLRRLAYAPEIAGEMLRRQQAGAVIAARKLIVKGAVSMVQDALEQLAAEHIVELDEERKAAMVSNLLVVLTSDRAVQPVVNAGTLYTG